MQCTVKRKEKKDKKMSAGVGGREGVDIDRRTYLGAKQMKDEKRVRTKSKRREQMSFELLSDKEQQHGNVRKSKGAAKAMPRDAAKWPLGRAVAKRDS